MLGEKLPIFILLHALSRTQIFTEYACKKLAKFVQDGQTVSVQAVSATKFKVTHATMQYVVDLVLKTCSGREFELDLIPCSHTAATIRQILYNCF